MKTLTKKQQRIAKRQELLSELIPGAISCDYIASVERKLPNGFEVKAININHKGFAWYLTAFNPQKEEAIYVSNEFVNIHGVDVYYIVL